MSPRPARGRWSLLCHGWPESWYSWRWQIKALAEAGFRAVAPDMRGYGESDRPEAIESYTLFHLVGDMVGLVDALGAERGGHRRPRLGRAGRLARRAVSARSLSRRRRLERAVPAARLSAADERDAADRAVAGSTSSIFRSRASPKPSSSATREQRSAGCCIRPRATCRDAIRSTRRETPRQAWSRAAAGFCRG